MIDLPWPVYACAAAVLLAAPAGVCWAVLRALAGGRRT